VKLEVLVGLSKLMVTECASPHTWNMCMMVPHVSLRIVFNNDRLTRKILCAAYQEQHMKGYPEYKETN